ncbi:MAG: putative dsRNA-binding protein [Trueperaceae bacterium]|nr:putative dsRNA-binding protein [Trueperaceae bacterium]
MAHPKGVLIERLQKEGRQPRFESRTSGPDHEPIFESDVLVDDEVLGRGSGPNKRTAERRAAEEALAALDTPAPPQRSSGRRRGGRGKSASSAPAEAAASPTTAAAPDAEAAAEPPASDDLDAAPFEGPWPVFETVFATSLRIAHDRVAAGLATDEARASIEAFALTLYKNMLQDLGEIVEEDDGD